MSLQKRRAVSEKMAAANRSNGSKSQGPITENGKMRSAANSYKHGLSASLDNETRQRMLRVGEDPDLLARLERELGEAWQPANAMEAMIVADIAKGYRDKAVHEDSVRGIRLEQRESKADAGPVDEQELRAVGCLNVDPRHEYFRQAHRLIDHLADRYNENQWTVDEDLTATLELLDGRPLLGWPREVLELFDALSKLSPEADAEAIAEKEREVVEKLTSARENLYEREDEYHQAKAEELRVELECRLVPGNRRWSTVLRQQARLDRMIASKLRLLLLVRKELRNSRSTPVDEKASILGDSDEKNPDQTNPATL